MTIQLQDLKRSHEFVEILFSNINSAIFIVDEQLKVQEFNTSFINMFGVVRQEVIGHLCGNILGCVYTENSAIDCGESNHCKSCALRDAVQQALDHMVSSRDLMIERIFHIKGQFVRKYFQFSSKPLNFEGRNFALLIVEDVTDKELRNQELMTQNHLITQYNQKFKNELQMAEKIQKDLIPNILPQSQAVRFAAQYISMDEIGGDLYDVFEIDDSTLGFYMCDVAGHGISAALITVMLKVIVEESTRLKHEPGAMVTHINEKLIAIFSDVYLTLFYGVYHKPSRQLTFVRAGHPQPILVRGNAYMSLMDHQNPLLGLDSSIVYETNRVQLKAGDTLLLFTDGVFEARDLKSEMFENRLYTYLSEIAVGDIESCLDGIMVELTHFVGQRSFEDDVCMLGIQLGTEEDLWKK